MALAAGLLVLGLLGLVVFSVSSSGDYATTGPLNDNAAPGIEALLHGSVSGYLARQPMMGLTSILLRLPFAALASSLGGGELTVYKFGALAAMLPLAFGATWLIAAPGLSTRQRGLRMLTVVVVIASPILRATVDMGHPEDLVAAVLVTTAVVSADSGRSRSAAILLGVAIGAKQWALIGVVPVMIALPGRGLEVAAITGALVAVLIGAVAVGDPAAFERALHAEGSIYMSPLSPLWPIASPLPLAGGGYAVATRAIPWGLTRPEAMALQGAAAALLGGACYVRLRRTGRSFDSICLLALLGALRCICDIESWQYYWVALLIPVATWECIRCRLPVITLLVSMVIWVLFESIGHVSTTVINIGALGGDAVLIGYLIRCGARSAGPDLDTDRPQLRNSISFTLARP